MVEEEHDEEEGTAEDEAPVKLSNEEVRQAIKTLPTYVHYLQKMGEVRAMATKICSVVESEFNRFSKQMTIEIFFKK